MKLPQTTTRTSRAKTMQHKSWPDLCESLLDRLEAKGENTTTERAEFGVLVAECGSSGCKMALSQKGENDNGD